MKENMKGFTNLIWLAISCFACTIIPSEVIHLLAIKEYGIGLFILIVGIGFFFAGSSTYGYILNDIRRCSNEDNIIQNSKANKS